MMETRSLSTKCWKWTIFISVSILAVSSTNPGRPELEKALRTKLATGDHFKDIAPPSSNGHRVTVRLDLTIIHIQSVNAVKDSLSIEGWLGMTWEDPRLSWDLKKFDNITNLRLPNHSVWKPDISLYNSANSWQFDQWAGSNVVVFHNGSVQYVPPVSFESVCTLDLTDYPYDTQNCSLVFGSWTHSIDYFDVVLLHHDKSPNLKYYEESNTWELVGSQAVRQFTVYDCCAEGYPSVTYSLQLKRRASNYKYRIVYPLAGIAVLTIAQFWLSPATESRILFSILLLIASLNVTQSISSDLPPSKHGPPVVVRISSCTLVLLILSLVVSIVFTRWNRVHQKKSPPKLIRLIANSGLGRILGVNKDDIPGPPAEAGDGTVEAPNKKLDALERSRLDAIRQEWTFCLTMLDRLFLLTYLVVYVALGVILFYF